MSFQATHPRVLLITLSGTRRAQSVEASGMMMEICHAHGIVRAGRHPAACGADPAVFRPGDFNAVLQALIDFNGLVSCGMLDEKKVDPDLWTSVVRPWKRDVGQGRAQAFQSSRTRHVWHPARSMAHDG